MCCISLICNKAMCIKVTAAHINDINTCFFTFILKYFLNFRCVIIYIIDLDRFFKDSFV
nr:MAG TPA: hypothetical protein [Caudoviricetes sp.]